MGEDIGIGVVSSSKKSFIAEDFAFQALQTVMLIPLAPAILVTVAFDEIKAQYRRHKLLELRK